MTKATDAVPTETDPSAEPLPPATASKGALPTVSGTGPGAWNDRLVQQIVQVANAGSIGDDPEAKPAALKRVRASLGALADIAPGDAIEDMLAAQLVAVHAAAMDCYQRAATRNADGEISLELWRECMKQANRASRTFAALTETLNRHRGKSGQQTVRVEHVTVADGGQAVIGPVTTGGEGG